MEKYNENYNTYTTINQKDKVDDLINKINDFLSQGDNYKGIKLSTERRDELIKNGKCLRNIRKSKKYNTKQMANICNVTSSQISNWEQGYEEVPVKIVEIYYRIGIKEL